MKRLYITALVALGLLYSGPAMAATTLSDTELAGVSGGGIDPHLGGQSLPQDQSNDQQQPEKQQHWLCTARGNRRFLTVWNSTPELLCYFTEQQ